MFAAATVADRFGNLVRPASGVRRHERRDAEVTCQAARQRPNLRLEPSRRTWALTGRSTADFRTSRVNWRALRCAEWFRRFVTSSLTEAARKKLA